MCGIIGYIGEKQAAPILIQGLKKLEYRGYDSSGLGVIDSSDNIKVCKTQGKIQKLIALIASRPLPKSTIGISHTRWATHGHPSRMNSHPHRDCTGKFLVVHNGIIENYQELKDALKKKKHKFVSETDTEVIAHLIEENYKGDLLAAVQKTIKRLSGAFALGVIAADHPETLIAARVGSPLIVGLGKNENYIASDVPAILDKTKRVIYLKDEQMAVLTKNRVRVFSFAGKTVRPKIDKATFSVAAAQKQGYAHFMLKEIHEQPEVLSKILSARLNKTNVHLDGIGVSDQYLKGIKCIIIVACGTAYHAGMVGKYVIEEMTRVPVSVDVSSEFRYRNPIIDARTLVLSISQSGETADTLAAVKEAKDRGAKIVSICNVVGSSLARESDGVLYTYAGPEIGVASTKAYTAQLMMLYLFALKLAKIKKAVAPKYQKEILKSLKNIPKALRSVLKTKAAIAKAARANSHFGCFLFLGRNMNFPSALEGALKLKEISYIPAEGYAAGEMKHGPIALIDEYRAVVVVCPEADTYEKTISNMQEINARRGKIIAIATAGDKTVARHAHHVVYVPSTHKLLTPLTVILPLQLMAYHVAVKLGSDVDQPRNLAKSVTVE